MNEDLLREQFVWLVQRLLTLLAGLAVFGDPELASRFRAELEGCRGELSRSEPGKSVDATARRCVALCQDYYQDAKNRQAMTQAEYNAIIDVLRQAISNLSGGNALHSTVISSALRFRELARLEDIGELRKKIEQEVRDLERSAEEKRKQGEQFVALLAQRLEVIEGKLCDTQDRLKKTESETAVDPLTGIANRRYFDRQLNVWVNATRNVSPFVLAMIDVDNFKAVNDQHGHQTGDGVLVDVARIMRKSIRNDDVLARYGGEEFIILFANMSLDRAEQRSLKILEAVRAWHFGSDNAKTALNITLSCGLTAFVDGDTAGTLLRRADDALYDAKQRGRNRVEIRPKSICGFSSDPTEMAGKVK